MESQRTNLITNSEYINTTDWNHQGVTSSVNTSETTSPEGVYNAVKFTATNTDPYIFRSVSVSTGDNTFSFYVKGTGSSVGKTARILFWYIGTATGTQTSHNFTLTDQWQRVDATTSPTGAGTLTFRIDIPADSAVIGDVCYLYGLQIESGSHVSSYVPTYGSAATRGADVCNSGGSAESINSTEGVAFVECSFLA
ncbi:MAG: phage head spike fiber domain-containing protein, partial [Paracoccaceae bacterium]